MAARARLAAPPARRAGPGVSRHLAVAALLVFAVGGCSMPQWVPYLGEKTSDKAAPAASPAAATPPASPPVMQRAVAPSDQSVTDRVLAVVNNDAITLSELQEAIAIYRYE